MIVRRLVALALLVASSSLVYAKVPLFARPVHRFTAHTAQGRDAAFSPDGRLLATSSVDSTVKLWRLSDNQLVATLRHPIGVTSIKFSPDGQTLVSGSYDSQVRLWNVATGTLIRTLKGHGGTVWSVDFAPDGKTVASSGEDKTIKIWRVADGTLLHTLSGHAANVWHIAFSPDGTHIASGSFDKTGKIWRTDTGALERTLTGSGEAIVGLGYSHNGQWLATCGDDEAIRIWRTSDGRLQKTIKTGNHVYSVAFSPDDWWLVSSGRARSAIGTFWYQIAGDRFSTATPPTVKLWQAGDGALIQELKGHSDDVMYVAFSPDGYWIASSSEDKTVMLWKVSYFLHRTTSTRSTTASP
jgi:WD40 repeat protein